MGYNQIAELAQDTESVERLRLAIDEHKNMMLDGFLFGIDECSRRRWLDLSVDELNERGGSKAAFCRGMGRS